MNEGSNVFNAANEQYGNGEKFSPFALDAQNKRDYFYKRWKDELVLIEGRKFQYGSLPVNLPAFELERRLIKQGHTTVWKHPIYGLVTAWGSIGGVGIYDNATKATCSQAVLGEFEGTDGVDCVIGYNTSRDFGFAGPSVVGQRLDWYANILADLDVSLSMIGIAARCTNTLGAKTDSAVEAIQVWYEQVYQGNYYVPLLESGVFEALVPMISKECADARTLAADLQMLKTSYLKQYYNSCGVAFIEKKAERMVTDEVAADEDMLSINIYDQLACRAEFTGRINALFGTNITVRVNNLIIT